MKLTVAIGDVHGMLDSLNEVLGKVRATYPDSELKYVFLGDYVDRGPDSKGVVDRLIQFSGENECVFLRGNHEDMILNDLQLCLMNGGNDTFRSYGWDGNYNSVTVDKLLALIPPEHMVFFKSTVTLHRDSRRIYVHAGIDRGRSLDDQKESTLLWVREPFLRDTFSTDPYVVHGHTPMENGKDPSLGAGRINLDTGAVFGGVLTAAVFSENNTTPIDIIQSGVHSTRWM